MVAPRYIGISCNLVLIVTAASPGLVKLNNKAAKNLRRSRATSRGLPKKGQWGNP